jgi:hypothetical protein
MLFKGFFGELQVDQVVDVVQPCGQKPREKHGVGRGGLRWWHLKLQNWIQSSTWTAFQ